MWKFLALIALAAAPAVAKDGWVSLFDGKSLDGWMSAAEGQPGKGWKVKDGAIHRAGGAGDILTREQFGDFELEFEWKISEGGNSGMKYRVRKSPRGWLGAEYQVLDDAGHPNGKDPQTSAAAIYDVVAPEEEKKQLKPVGEWNASRIVAKGGRIEHWLNGEKVLEVDLSSPEWEKARKDSKFSRVGDFAAPGRGRILLQDHGDEVWFREIRIREL